MRGTRSLLRCSACGLVFARELPGRGGDFLADAGSQLRSSAREKVEYWSFPELYSRHAGVFDRFFRERLSRIRAHAPAAGPYLDVGCGYGLWMNHLRREGLACSGFDPSEEAVRHCREAFGLDARVGTLETYSSAERFAAVVMCDVLEHLEEPGRMLEKCRELLAPGGVLYVQVPNVLGLRIPYGHGLGLPHHLWQFNPKTLLRLLRKSGLEPIAYWTGVQGVIGVYENGGPGLLDRLQWKLARGLRIGNRLQVLARAAGGT